MSTALGSAAEPTEVLVEGERHPQDGSYVTRRESRELPGTFGDPLRSVEAMPGVSGLVSGFPYFYVRGAPPGNVGYLFDGIRVPMLYHAFAGPSVLQPAFIESVELHRGGFSSRFSHFAGAVLDARSATPPTEFHVDASLRLYDAGGLVSVPFADGRGTLMLGGRYSYTGLLVSALSPVKLEYWDYQALVTYALTARDRLTLLAFGAYDYSAQPDQHMEAGVQFHRADLRYAHDLASGGQFKLALTLGQDRSRQEDNSYIYIWGDQSRTNGEGVSLRDRLIAGRTSLEHRIDPRVEFRAGGDFALDAIHLSQRSADKLTDGQITQNYPTRNDFVFGFYDELEWAPTRALRVAPGLRVDGYFSQGKSALALEPRIVASFEVSRRLTLRHSFGVTHQPPSAAPPGLPGAQQVAGLPGGLQRALQASSSAELKLPSDLTGSLTLFESIYDRLSDPVGTTGDFAFNKAATRSQGSAYGIELSVRRPLTRRLGGFLNYTLSRTTRHHDSVESLSAFDHAHVANLALAYDLGAAYRAGVRFFYQSGVPVRRVTTAGPVYDGSERAPGFFRVDVRFEKRFKVWQTGSLSLVAELMNATFGKEVLRRNCNTAGCSDGLFGPLFLPSLGAELSY